ncbi:MAG: hypothetical protein UW76_C0042G0001, partial [Parcubacteria group bacterium GW2011_GWF2_44_8b]
MIDDVQFLEYVVKALVSYPDDIKIKRTVDEMGVLMSLDVHPDDMGKVIGRSGNTAKAIRILLRVVGMKNNARVNLKINEPEGAAPREIKTTKTVDESLEDLKGLPLSTGAVPVHSFNTSNRIAFPHFGFEPLSAKPVEDHPFLFAGRACLSKLCTE